MKKISSSATLGGAPFYKSDFREVFNQEIWAALDGVLSKFAGETEGVIVSGCQLSANGSNFDMTEGVVYLNGEYMRVAAVSNQSFTKYIVPSAVVNDTRQFADLTNNVLFETKGAEVAASAPGSGQYITIASLSGPNARRLSNFFTYEPSKVNVAGDSMTGPLTSNSTAGFDGGVRSDSVANGGKVLKKRVIEIGDWNMDANAQKEVLHGMGADYKKIRNISVIVRGDDDGNYYTLERSTQGAGWHGLVSGTVSYFDETSIWLIRLDVSDGGWFDGSGFDSTGYNRGWITIEYEA